MPLTLKIEAMVWLTPYEERIIEAILEEGDVRSAAYELKIKPSTVYGVLSNIRVKLVKSQNTVNQCNVFKKKSHVLRRLLVPIQKIPINESHKEQEELGENDTQT